MATTIRIPVDLRTPAIQSNAGNSFWTVEALTAHDFGAWQYLPNVSGNVFGIAHVPKNIAGAPNAKLVMVLAANSTAGEITSMNVLTGAIASDAESLNPGALTDEGVVDVTMPTVAFETKEQSFALAVQPSADDLLIVIAQHQGAKTEDTLVVNTILAEFYLEIDII